MTHRTALAFALLFSTAAIAAPPPVTPMTPDTVARFDPVRADADFIRRVAMIPMRDGVKLYTVIVMKKGTANGPILLTRTPYDAKGNTSRLKSQRIVDILPAIDADFVQDGYIRVYQDIRGLHHSEGDYVTNRPLAGPLNDTLLPVWNTVLVPPLSMVAPVKKMARFPSMLCGAFPL